MNVERSASLSARATRALSTMSIRALTMTAAAEGLAVLLVAACASAPGSTSTNESAFGGDAGVASPNGTSPRPGTPNQSSDAGASKGGTSQGGASSGGTDAPYDAGPSAPPSPGADGSVADDGGGTTTTTVNGPTDWLHTQGNKILHADGKAFHGRGANIHDTRSCWACAWARPNPAEVERRLDELIDRWHATFVRLDLESYATQDQGMVQWQGVLNDPAYLADIQRIVAHIGQKPGVYVMVSLWVDATFSAVGWPTQQTQPVWQKLAETFKDSPHVLYGLVNEPQSNFNGQQDAQVWAAMNTTVQSIRDVEARVGAPHHVVAVQGTRAWARRLDYYVSHPITAGGGTNIAYETHVYDPASQFDTLFGNPAKTLPVIVGEFGPSGMTEDECGQLMQKAEALEVPYLAWTFHQRCPPNLLQETAGGCGIGMPLRPTSWGQRLKDRLAVAW